MKNLTTFNQLVNQFHIKNFVDKTIHQINKDLNGLHCDLIQIETNKNEDVLTELILLLQNILNQLDGNSQLQQFIYTVDLNEKNWLDFIQKQDFKGLSEQIIIREAQKVYLRELYKKD